MLCNSSFIIISGIQGVILYRQLRSSIFSSRSAPGKLQILLTFGIGYGVPVCFVISLLLTSYFDGISHYIRISDDYDTTGDPTLCWIDTDSMLWAFIGPLLFILLSNLFIVIMVLKTAMEAHLRLRQA